MFNKTKRITEVGIILDKFKVRMKDRYNLEVNFKKSSNKLIVDTYEIILNDLIRTVLKPGVNAEEFKVASGLELATIYTQPINGLNPNKDRKLNAVLASSIASNYCIQCFFDDIELKTEDKNLNKAINEITAKHIDWLIYIDSEDYFKLPVISNAIFWETYSVLYASKLNKPILPLRK